MNKIIEIPSTLRITVPANTTQEQINAITRNVASVGCATMENIVPVIKQFIHDVASDYDKQTVASVEIADADLWVDDTCTVRDEQD